MTATTLLGPFLIGFALRAGASPNWPPDRPIEWAIVLGTAGLVVGLMGACLTLAVTNRPAPIRPASGPNPTDATEARS